MAADGEGVVSVSTSLKQKMAGKLSGSLKTATEDRLAKAEAVMASGGLLKAAEAPAPASKAHPHAVTPKTPPASRRTASKSASKPAAPVDVEPPAPPAGKIKVQRETFTMLPAESDKINEVRTRAAANKVFTNRSAVIRAGILALERLSDEQLLQVLGRLTVVKPGRAPE
jgi:hypothetical protein